MSRTIERGTVEHNDHLALVEKEKLIADNQPKILDLKEKSKTAKLEELKAINDEIAKLENPKVAVKKVAGLNQSEYDAGFELGKNRQQLSQGASESKKAGYMAGMSSGNGGTSTSPVTAFSKPPEKELIVEEKVVEVKTTKIPERKTE